MSELVVLTITVPETSNPNSSPLSVELTNGALSTGAAFKNIVWMSMVWAEGFDSGCTLMAPTSGGAALLAVTSSGGLVTGSIGVYPALDVPVTFVLTGRNAVVIGKQDLDAGETAASFSWPVGQDDGLSAIDVAGAIRLFLQS